MSGSMPESQIELEQDEIASNSNVETIQNNRSSLNVNAQENSSSAGQKVNKWIINNKIKPVKENVLLKFLKQKDEKISQKSKNKCKILKFTDEWTYNEVLKNISKIKKSSYESLFVFMFELNMPHNSDTTINNDDDYKQLKGHLIKFDENRPMIFQMTSKTQNETKIFYKAENSNNFIEINQQQVELDNFENFPSFFSSFMNLDFENLEELLIQKLFFIEELSVILRFLRIFDFSEKFFQDLVEKFALCDTEKEFLAALDIPFGHEEGISNYPSSNVLSQVFECLSQEENEDPKEKSILLNAIEQPNADITRFLIKNCKDLIQRLPYYHQLAISTTAYNENEIKILCDLIHLCDFPFPENFDSNAVRNEKFAVIIRKRTELHEAIKENKLQKINDFIKANPHIKNGYDCKNDSALYQAVSTRNFKILCHLKTRGFKAIEFDDFRKFIDNEDDLQDAERIASSQRRQNVKNALPSENKTINSLTAMSYIHNKHLTKEKQEEYNTYISKWYKEIYQTGESRPTFDIVASCKKLKVVFNFESISTTEVDMSDSSTEGVAYMRSGIIIIGAKYLDRGENLEDNIKGVIAHEFSHYVMYMVFDNDEKPYYKEDKKTAKLFQEITKDIKELLELNDDKCNGIVSSVFTCYHEQDHIAELIVRVLQMLVKFRNNLELLSFLRDYFQQLFDFYRDHVIPHLVKYLSTNREIVRRFNEKSQVMSRIKLIKIDFQRNISEDIDSMIENQLNVVTSNQPLLLMVEMYKSLCEKYGNLQNVKNIFVTLEEFNNSQKLKDILSVNSSLNIFVDCSKGVGENLSHILDNNQTNFIFIVPNESENGKLTKIINNLKLKKQLSTTWDIISVKSKEKILQTKVNIRGNQTTIYDLFSKSPRKDNNMGHSVEENYSQFSDIMNDQLFSLLLNQSEITINTDCTFNEEDDTEFEKMFMQRMFIKKLSANETSKKSSNKNGGLSEAELIEDVKNEEIVLIADIAGAGKSWAMQSVVENYKKSKASYWISHVDLKQHIQIFKSDHETNPEFDKVLIHKILKSQDILQTNVFLEMYKKGKVLSFFDGFDEIAPDCAEYVTKLAKSFKSNGGNRLWIATRDYFEVDLQKELNINNIYKLKLFTEQDEVEFITSSLTLGDLGEAVRNKTRNEIKNLIINHENYPKHQKNAKELNQKIAAMRESPVGIPQFFKILVKVLQDGKNENTEWTIFKIFKKFVKIQIKIWSTKKGEIRGSASFNTHCSYAMNFLELHIFFAMRGLYPEIFTFCGLAFEAGDWLEAEIIACGLLIKRGEKFYFIHETLREFFAAQFIVRTVMKYNSNVDNEFCKFLTDFLTIPKYKIVRMFLNEALNDKKVMEKFEQAVPKIAEYCFKNLNEIKFCLESYETNLQDVSKKIFDSEIYDKKKQLFETKIDKMIETQDFNLIEIELIFSTLRFEDVKKLLKKVNKWGNNLLHLLVIYSKLEILEKTFEVLKKNFSSAQYEEVLKSKGYTGRNLLQSAAVGSKDIQIHKFLWQIFRNLSGSDEQFIKYLQEVDEQNNNVINLAASFASSEILDFMIEELEKMTSRDEIKKILNILGYYHKNLLQHAAVNNKSLDSNKTVWKIIEKYFGKTEIEEMINHCDSNNDNVLHCVVCHNQLEVVEFLLEKIKNYFSNTQNEEVLKSKGFFRRNLLQSAAVSSKDIKVHKFLWQIFRKLSGSDEKFIKYLPEIDEQNNNVIHLAASFATSEILDFMIEELEKMTSRDEIKKFLNILAKQNQNLLQQAAINNKSLDSNKTVWKIIEKYFEKTEIVKMINHCDSNNDNILHCVVRYNKLEVFEFLLEKIKNYFSSAQYEEVLKSKGYIERNLLQSAAVSSKDIEMYKFLWRNFRNLTANDEKFIKYLQEVDEQNSNVIHLAASFASSEILDFTIEELEKMTSRDEIRKILNILGYYNKNLLQQAAVSNKSLDSNKTLWKIIEKYFGKTEIVKMINHCHSNNDNILHCAVCFNQLEVVEFIWEKIKNFINETENQTEYFKRKGWSGQNLLERSCMNKNDEKVKAWVENFNIFSNCHVSRSSNSINLRLGQANIKLIQSLLLLLLMFITIVLYKLYSYTVNFISSSSSS